MEGRWKTVQNQFKHMKKDSVLDFFACWNLDCCHFFFRPVLIQKKSPKSKKLLQKRDRQKIYRRKD